MKNEWQKNLTNFLNERTSIRLFVHLVDSRHRALDIDKNVDEYIRDILRADQKVLRIFTKADKLNQKEKNALRKDFPHALLISSSKKSGIDKALESIFISLFGENNLL